MGKEAPRPPYNVFNGESHCNLSNLVFLVMHVHACGQMNLLRLSQLSVVHVTHAQRAGERVVSYPSLVSLHRARLR